MSIRLFSLFFVLAAACGLIPSSQALDFRVVSWDGEIHGLHFASGKKTVEIMGDEAMFSPSYTVMEAGPLVLFREIQQEGKTVRVPVASLAIPTEFTRAILVLAATDSTRTTYTGLWIDDSPEARPPQTITVRNLSSHTVAVKFGETERTLAAGEISTFATDASMQRVRFKMAALTKTGWEVVASSSQPVRPGRRTLILLRDGRPQAAGIQEIIDMVTINDRLPPPPPSPSVAGR